LPEVDKAIQKGDVIGTIESVKAVSEIYAPVSGTVTEVNTLLDDKPETINGDPHGVGWYCKLKLSDTGELDGLMDAAAYQEFAGAQ
jgi:glycine cleavage system H protein